MTASPAAPEPSVLVHAEGGVGHLTLNRPRAINALDLAMVHTINEALDAWERDPAIHVVVLDGAGDRGLCAGGDVRSLYEHVKAGHAEQAAAFFRAEYALNARIAEYPLPFVAFADGVTMGGGIGLAGHAAVRVVTERSKLAMPETRIGFTPDVGGTWLLGRAPGRLGEFLGVTGTVMDASDAVYAGFADHVVPSARLAELRDALRQVTAGVSAHEVVARFALKPAPSVLAAARAWVDDAFAADTVTDVARHLAVRSEPAASDALRAIEQLSPTGMSVTMQAVRRARELPSLRAALAQEYGLVTWFAHTQPDLVEGIRAQLVDKDRSPRWNPASLAEVTDATVAAAFAYTPDAPLWG